MCCKAARRIGPATYAVVQQLLSDKPLHRLRSVQAILKLEETVGGKRLEAACKRALFYGDVQYRRIKDILNAALDQEPLPTNHPVSEGQAHRFARNVREFFHASENTLQ